MTPRASFVIPAYNMERWLSKTIWSCRNQTIKNIEIIVINDGSTDGTKDILDWHAKEDKRVVAVHQENQGRSMSRNNGNDRVSSDLVLVLDADDMATRNRVKDTLAVFELKKPDVVYGSFFKIDSLGTVLDKFQARPFDPTLAKEKRFNFICHSTMAYTKKVSETVRYDTGDFSRLGMDDWRFQWEAYQKGFKFQHLKTPLAYYRWTEDGISAVRDAKEVNRVKDVYLATI